MKAVKVLKMTEYINDGCPHNTSEQKENEVAVAFLCCVFDKKLAAYVIQHDRNFPQLAANKLGWMFIEGLEHYYKGLLNVFSVINVSSFPGFSDLLISPKHTQTSGGSSLFYVPYINIKFIKHLIIAISSFYLLAKWAIKSKNHDRILVVYSMYAPFPFVAQLLCFCFSVKSILIVPDLPEYMRIGVSTPWYLGIFLRINQWQLYFFSNLFDGYIFLTKFMSEHFNVKPEKYAVIEGCVDSPSGDRVASFVSSDTQEERILLYAGQLNDAYGVGILLAAFTSLRNPMYRLWLCGSGPMRKEVLSYCERDKRIKYFGVLSNDDVNVLSLKVTALINPRTADGVFTKYSFPSKILEYLKSGKPVIICRLEGIPEEYYRYTYVIEEQNERGFAAKIDEVLSKSVADLSFFGRNSQQWVYTNKNSAAQTKTLVKIIKKVIG